MPSAFSAGFPALTSYILGLLDDADAATARATLNTRPDGVPSWPPLMYATSYTGTWVGGNKLGLPFGINFYNSTHAQNDAVTWTLPYALSAGTYTLRMTEEKKNVCAIATFETSINGSSWTALTTIDTYNSGDIVATSTVTGLTIPAGTAYLRMTAATRNASAVDWYLVPGSIELVRTA